MCVYDTVTICLKAYENIYLPLFGDHRRENLHF